MLAFITGISGQDGSYLAELLLEKNYKVYGIVRRTSLLYSHTRLDHIRNKINLRYGDMTDMSSLHTFIHSILNENPDYERLEIYNLAAQSHVGISFEIPEYTADVDGMGVLRLLEVIRSINNPKIRFYQAGTSELFGSVVEIPQNEKTPFNPVSPYAAAKLYGYYITKVYREAYNVFAVNGILFNHESPRRGENFVTMKIINGVKNIHNGTQTHIELGNLNSQRDWGHAKDFVRGMWLMMQQDTAEDFVLATGRMYSVREFAERAFQQKGYTIKWEGEGEGLKEVGIDQNGIVRVKVNSKYYRPCEVDLLLGDAEKARKRLGWACDTDLDTLISNMFSE
jgi:GDPmannose 4,6-dehydratase